MNSYSEGWGGDEYGAGQDEYLITPSLNLSNKKNAILAFQFSGNKNALNDSVISGKTTLTLEATTDEGKNWTSIWKA